MHELGHLIGGFMGGYKLYYVEVFGLFLIKDEKGFRLGRSKKVPVGQCIMYHEDVNKNPVPLIVGGLAQNFLLVLFGTIMFFVINGIVLRTVFLIISISNMSLVLMNIFGSSSSDGMTLKEVLGSKTASRMYNEIMILYYLLGDPQNKLTLTRNSEKSEIAGNNRAENKEKEIKKIEEQIEKDLRESCNCHNGKGSLREELEMLFRLMKEQGKDGFVGKNF